MHFGAKQDFARTYGWGHLIYKIMLCITLQIVNKSFKLCIVFSNNCYDEEQEMSAQFKLIMIMLMMITIMMIIITIIIMQR